MWNFAVKYGEKISVQLYSKTEFILQEPYHSRLRIVMWYNTKILEDHSASIFSPTAQIHPLLKRGGRVEDME
jgi:hypothetical protein